MTTFVGYFDQPNPGVAAKMEDMIDVGFKAVRLNFGFNDADGSPTKGGGKYLDRELDRLFDKYGYHARGYWNMNLDPPLTFGGVARHEHDDVIRARAILIKENPRFTHDNPLFVSPHHEQSVDNENQPGGGLPEDYPGFFQRVYEIFKEEGILRSQGGSVMLCFVCTAGQFKEKLTPHQAPWAVDKIAPDPKFYQYAGCDIYSKPDYKRMDALDLDAVSAWAKKVGKKFVIGECGAFIPLNAQTGAGQAAWIKDVYNRLKSYGTKNEPGSCNMVAWTFKDFPDGTSTRVDEDVQAMAAFATMMKDPNFQRAL